MQEAIDKEKRIVFLVETDAKHHGGVPLRVHEQTLRTLVKQTKTSASSSAEEVEQAAKMKKMYDYLYGREKDISTGPAARGGRVRLIPWYRYKELQEVSMRLLV